MTGEETTRERRNGSVPLAVSVCLLFFVSGSAGLVYEVAWKHTFAVVFGNTTYAVSVLISVFMGGLALGSYVFGKVADRTRRHLLVFAALQLGIAASALLVLPALERAEGLYRAVFRASGSPALLLGVQAIVSAGVLLVPTFLMGGTLPVLSRFIAARRRQVGPAVGVLYGLNTLGAAAGAFLAGFVLIKALGIAGTVRLAACANLALGLTFAGLHAVSGPARALEVPDGGAEPPVRPLGALQVAVLLVAVAVSGFVSFSYEVVWTRLLTFRLNTSVYAFSAMLTAFLLGVGLGGALVGMARKRRPRAAYWRLYGCLEAGVGICGLGTILVLAVHRPVWVGPEQGTLWRLGISMLLMIVPTMLMGAAFPIACHLFAGGVERTGRSVGSIYVFNTAGAIAGALLTGFVLVQALGTRGALTLASFLMVVSGSAVLALSPAPAEGAGRKAWLRAAVPLAVIWPLALLAWRIVPSDFVPDYFLRSQSYYSVCAGQAVLVGYKEGVEDVVVVAESPEGYRSIASGATQVAGTDFTVRNTQKLQCHVPMLLHPDPQMVCQVGFGSGETADLFLSYGIERLDCVEISQTMLDMATAHFADINDNVVSKPRLRAIVMDGAAYLKYADQTYDVIANDSIWPHLSGNSSLYTLEYFRNGRQHLRPGGIMTSWLPLDMPLADLKIVLATFHEVFPHVYVWTALSHQNMHALLVGSDRPLQVDVARFASRFERYARRDLEIVHLDNPAAFAACHLARIEGRPSDLAGVALNTVDRTVLQYLESRPEVARPDTRKHMVPRSLGFLSNHRDPILTVLTGADAAEEHVAFLSEVKRMIDANERVLQAAIARLDDPARGQAELESALAIAPEHPYFVLTAYRAGAAFFAAPVQLEEHGLADLPRIVGTASRGGNLAAAREPLLDWEAREPQSVGPQLGLGLLFLTTGETAEAVQRLARAVKMSPGLVDAQLGLGIAYLQDNQRPAGMRHLETALTLAPRSAAVHEVLGSACAAGGDVPRGIEQLQQAVALDPARVRARMELASLLLRQGRPAEAAAHLEAVVQLDPGSVDAHARLSTAYRLAGDAEGALRHAQRSAELKASGGQSAAARP